MNIIFSVLLGLIAITPALAAKCVTYGEGTLTTSETTFTNGSFTGQFKPFAFNFRGELSFYHATKHPTIQVQFQTCLPNYSGNDNSYMDKAGRIYIPATKQCLAVNNPNSKGPYHVVAKSCPNSAAGEMGTAKSIPFNWLNSRGYISWIGNSAHDRSRLQGGCPGGDWGFRADVKTRTPITDKSGEYRVDLVCLWNSDGGTFWTH